MWARRGDGEGGICAPICSRPAAAAATGLQTSTSPVLCLLQPLVQAAVDVITGAAQGLQLVSFGFSLNKELQRKKKKGNSTGSSNILLLPVCTSMSTLGTTSAICLEPKVST